MKPRYFILLITIILILAVNTGFFFALTNTGKTENLTQITRTIKVENMSLNIPAGIVKDKTVNSEGWSIHQFRKGELFFRISITKGNEQNVKVIVKNYLKISKVPKKERFCISKWCYLKRINEMSSAFYFINQSQNKTHYVFTFLLNGEIYYIDLFAPSQSVKFKRLFDKAILSIKYSNYPVFNNRKRKLLQKELEKICMDTYFLLCYSEGIFMGVIPAIIELSIVFLFFLGMRGMGNLPEDIVSSGIIPVYSEASIDTVAKSFSKRQWFLTALIVDNKGLRFYYRKKEFLFVSIEEAKNKIKKGKSIVGRYLEIETENKELKHKPLSLKSRLIKKIILRFYIKDIDRVLAIIKGL